MDFIKVPRWFDKELIESNTLLNFIEEAKFLDDNKIDLNYLRDYYKINRSKALDIIDELSLRGYEFHFNGVNNILPDYRFNSEEEIIISDYNHDKFRNIDFNLIGLSNIINRYNIISDDFFSLIPISGFKAIVKFPEYNMIKNEFIKAGFLVQSSNEKIKHKEIGINKLFIEEIFNNSKFSEISIYFSENNKKTVDSINMYDVTQIGNILGINTEAYEVFKDILLSTYVLYCDKCELDKYLINEVFAENKFNAVKRYCYFKKINKVTEINNSDIKAIFKSRGMGIKKYSDFKDQLLDFYVHESNVNDRDVISNSNTFEIDRLTIGEAFSISKYKLVLEYFSESIDKPISSISTIDLHNIEKVYNRNPIQYDIFKDRLLEIYIKSLFR